MKDRRWSARFFGIHAIPGVVVAAFLICAMPQADAIILIVVLGPIELFEIEGITFTSYATSEEPVRVRVTDTDDGFSGEVELRGQAEGRTDLHLLAVSVADPRQQIRLEMDTHPLPGPPREGITSLESRPVPIEPPVVTDRALEPFTDPLAFGFRFVRQTPDPGTGGTRSDYLLEQIEPVPEPSSALLAFLGLHFLVRRAAQGQRSRLLPSCMPPVRHFTSFRS